MSLVCSSGGEQREVGFEETLQEGQGGLGALKQPPMQSWGRGQSRERPSERLSFVSASCVQSCGERERGVGQRGWRVDFVAKAAAHAVLGGEAVGCGYGSGGCRSSGWRLPTCSRLPPRLFPANDQGAPAGMLLPCALLHLHPNLLANLFCTGPRPPSSLPSTLTCSLPMNRMRMPPLGMLLP